MTNFSIAFCLPVLELVHVTAFQRPCVRDLQKSEIFSPLIAGSRLPSFMKHIRLLNSSQKGSCFLKIHSHLHFQESLLQCIIAFHQSTHLGPVQMPNCSSPEKMLWLCKPEVSTRHDLWGLQAQRELRFQKIPISNLLKPFIFIHFYCIHSLPTSKRSLAYTCTINHY